MIEIKKGTPSAATASEINAQLTNPGWARVSSTDTKAKRTFFDNMDKSVIRKDLLKEQHYLCGYCMRAIDDSTHTKIEHIIPVSSTLAADKDKVLDYSNYLAVCDGGEHIPGKGKMKGSKSLCCDAAKGSDDTKVDPHKSSDMDKIAYSLADGRIFTQPVDDDIEEAIKKMHLNGYYNSAGKFVCDTRTELLKRRRDVMKVEYKDFIGHLIETKKLSSALVKKRIDVLKNAQQRKEYIGIAIYFLEEKYKSLKDNGK